MWHRTVPVAAKRPVIVALFLVSGTLVSSADALGPVSGRLASLAALAPQPVGREGNRANQQLSGTATGAAESEGTKTNAEVRTYTLPPAKYKQAVEFARARYRLYPVEVVYGIVVLFIILHWRLAVRFRDWAEARSSRRFVQALIYAPLLLVTLGVLGLPGEIYRQSLELKYQQSVQGWGSWAWDWAKGGFVSLAFGTFLVWILYGLIRRSPRRWWLYLWLVSIPLTVLLVFLQPLVIDPLFFRFEPLAQRQPVLAGEITQVVERAGFHIPPDRMFEMNASAKLNSLNAYVAGLGASKRVVVWDTTIAKLTVLQTLAVFGHEMGHYVLGHIWKGIAFAVSVIFLFLYLGYRGMTWTLGRCGPGWDLRGVDDWASLPVLLLFLSVFNFLGSPVFSAFSRYLEHQADVYGLEVIHGLVPDSAQVAAQSFQVMGEVDLSDPDPNPIVEFWLFSHPSTKERIYFALHYDPWSKGLAPQFVRDAR
jgi:Zn-dependent protease with chaperone function